MDNANFNKMVWKRSEGSEERVLHTVEAASVKAQCGEQAWHPFETARRLVAEH